MGMKPHTLILVVAAFCGTITSACSGPDSRKVLSPTRIYQVTKPFTDDAGGVAVNISGLACMWGDAARLTCLMIDDQGRFAQVATIGSGTVAAGARLRLSAGSPQRIQSVNPRLKSAVPVAKETLRTLTERRWHTRHRFFYVVGSHGCSRHSKKFRSSSFILTRIPESQVGNFCLRPKLCLRCVERGNDVSSVGSFGGRASGPAIFHTGSDERERPQYRGLGDCRREVVCRSACADTRRKRFHCYS